MPRNAADYSAKSSKLLSPENEPLTGLSPIADQNANTLILGTMPGKKSLEAGQYYAHPQNQFWRILGQIYNFSPLLSYDSRVEVLKQNGIAVWDVLHSCVRSGSMDADIEAEEPNDFKTFFKQHPAIVRVVFDSIKAEQLYISHILPSLPVTLSYYRVPSPSPAYARIPFAEKLAAWERILSV